LAVVADVVVLDAVVVGAGLEAVVADGFAVDAGVDLMTLACCGATVFAVVVTLVGATGVAVTAITGATGIVINPKPTASALRRP